MLFIHFTVLDKGLKSLDYKLKTPINSRYCGQHENVTGDKPGSVNTIKKKNQAQSKAWMLKVLKRTRKMARKFVESGTLQDDPDLGNTENWRSKLGQGSPQDFFAEIVENPEEKPRKVDHFEKVSVALEMHGNQKERSDKCNIRIIRRSSGLESSRIRQHEDGHIRPRMVQRKMTPVK